MSRPTGVPGDAESVREPRCYLGFGRGGVSDRPRCRVRFGLSLLQIWLQHWRALRGRRRSTVPRHERGECAARTRSVRADDGERVDGGGNTAKVERVRANWSRISASPGASSDKLSP